MNARGRLSLDDAPRSARQTGMPRLADRHFSPVSPSYAASLDCIAVSLASIVGSATLATLYRFFQFLACP